MISNLKYLPIFILPLGCIGITSAFQVLAILVFLFCRCGISRILSKFAIAKTAEADRRTRPGGEDRAMAHLQHATLANNNRRICRQ